MATLKLSTVITIFCIYVCTVAAQNTVLPPRLSTEHETIVVDEGNKSVVLECALQVGDDPIAYQWLKNNEWVTGGLGYAYRVYRKVLLALHTITPEHEGDYVCKASNNAGVDYKRIKLVVVKSETKLPATSAIFRPQLPEESLYDLAASLNDVLAEGDCDCDAMFLIHANPDVSDETISAQANLVHTISEYLVSSSLRVSVATYSDYLGSRLTFGEGTNRCALQRAFENLEHKKWATQLERVLREVFKKFKKSKKSCKVLFLPIFGSIGQDGNYLIEAKKLKKMGVKIFILDVSVEPTLSAPKMASMRGDMKPYYWYFPYKTWPSIVYFMKYMIENLSGCMTTMESEPGICVQENEACETNEECYGVGMSCIDGTCQYLECNADSTTEGCCSSPGDFWCGDVTRNCTDISYACDGQLNCMNGKDEDLCDKKPCDGKAVRCVTSHICLDLFELCDGKFHCPGGEDEEPMFCKSFACPTNRPFRCKNGQCISNDHLCDGAFKHCPDGEDEDLGYCAKVHTCPMTASFKCDYGKCIKDESVCDGVYNCLDAEDEISCVDKNCPADRPFKCDNGLCIDELKVCNGIMDKCSDGSDERNCTEFVCPFDRSYKCNNGICIDRFLECNGNDDCKDGSDELNCDKKIPSSTTQRVPPSSTRPESVSTDPPTFTSVGCSQEEFQCGTGACIPQSKVCDSRKNCIDGDDEKNCTLFPCPENRPFRCNDQSCVDAKLCDGIPDCGDHSDEEDCSTEASGKDTEPSVQPSSSNEDFVIDESVGSAAPDMKPVDNVDNMINVLDEPQEVISEPSTKDAGVKAGECWSVITIAYIVYMFVR